MLKMINSKSFHQVYYLFPFFCLMLFVLLINSCGGGGTATLQINPLSSAKDITSFSILGINGTIAGNTITLNLPNGTVVKALVATFTTTGQTVRVGATIQLSGQTVNNFTNPVTYRVTAEDASAKDYVVTVTVAPAPVGAIIAGHQAAANFNAIPQAQIQAVKANLHIAYGHTSHGSQIITGMKALADSNSLYSGLDLRDSPFSASDLGSPDRTNWATATRSYLDDPANSDVNVVIWSWCGQVSDASDADINTYLNLMNELEQDYPNVKFVYMTGHLDGGGSTGNLHLRNQQIRNYCNANNKILFDFADIESYDPNGAYYLARYATDGCNYDFSNNGETTQDGDPALPTNGDRNWAIDWITAHPGDALTPLANQCDTNGCAHSQGLNCALKGRAAWWLWARLAGWNGIP